MFLSLFLKLLKRRSSGGNSPALLPVSFFALPLSAASLPSSRSFYQPYSAREASPTSLRETAQGQNSVRRKLFSSIGSQANFRKVVAASLNHARDFPVLLNQSRGQHHR